MDASTETYANLLFLVRYVNFVNRINLQNLNYLSTFLF